MRYLSKCLLLYAVLSFPYPAAAQTVPERPPLPYPAMYAETLRGNDHQSSQETAPPTRDQNYYAGTGVIYQGEKVAGYYFIDFLKKDFEDKLLFSVQFVDADLQEISQKEFISTSYMAFSAVTYDGSDLTVYHQSYLGSHHMKVYNNKLNMISEILIPANIDQIHPVIDGCVVSVPGPTKKDGSNVYFASKYGAGREWAYNFHQGDTDTRLIDVTEQYTIFSLQTTPDGSRKPTFDLAVIDNRTGEIVCGVVDFTQEKLGEFFAADFNGTRLKVLAAADADPGKRNPGQPGLIQYSYNLEGNQYDRRTIQWQTDLREVAEAERMGAATRAGVRAGYLEDDSVVLYLDPITTDKRDKTYGPGLALLLDSTLAVRKSTWIDKQPAGDETALQPGPPSEPNRHEFNLLSSDGEMSTAAYFQRTYKGKETTTHALKLVTCFDGEFTEDVIDLENTTDEVRVHPGKPGFVMLEIFRAEKGQMERKLVKLGL